ncbi:hypothetical protein PROFUN_01929 [Planoprotostelium fungivorum]|uniref:GH16 domain-containing protein n=1 Tax=Planoprotostelium fungivorum TaxID=1890364 RepID=A0A2P6NZ43_9EUKA|nr:hypothetical protein PROFUN_01929 [Planoprotostelium fungivorum]
MKVLLLALCLVATVLSVTVPIQPWLNILNDKECKYERCVEVDFSKVDFDVPSTDPLFSDMFWIAADEGGEDGTYSCAKPDPNSTRCLFDPQNVYVKNGVLELAVPGGKLDGETISTSQIRFVGSEFIVSGVFEIVAQTSAVPGTCQAIFTQANPGFPAQKDEQDIEMLTGHYTEASDNIKAGLQLTSWNAFPTGEHDRQQNQVVDYGFDPTADFNVFRIEWDRNTTTYTYGESSVTFEKYSSQNPSKFVVNNWSNAGKFWTEGPPKEDSIMRIRSYKAYYNTKKN